MFTYAPSNSLEYFIYLYKNKWNGTEQSTHSFLNMLETMKNWISIDEDIFVSNLIKLKSYINAGENQHPGVMRTTQTTLLPGVVYQQHTETFKKLNEGLDRLLPNFSEIAIQPLIDFMTQHPIESSTKLILLIVFILLMIPVARANSASSHQQKCQLDLLETCTESADAVTQSQQHHAASFRLFTPPAIESVRAPMQQEIQQLRIVQAQHAKGGDPILPSHDNLKRIQHALEEVGNLPLLKLIRKNEVGIVIVSEEYMLSLVKIPNFSGCFIATPYNSILLNEHIFKNWNNLAKNQLTTILANELSHASVHNNKPLEQREPQTNHYQALVPWHNDAEKELYLDAYKHFTDRVKEYKRLIKRKKLNEKNQQLLEQYDNAVSSYIPPQHESSRHTALQEQMSQSDDGSILVYKNIYDTEPPIHQQKQRLDYLRRAFFQSFQNKEIQQLLYKQNFGIYQKENMLEQNAADEFSDWETLSPNMRETFGRELCSYSTNVYFKNIYSKEDGSHCNRPGWPRN